MIPGLVSVTFRCLSPAEICALCERAGLKAVEWGGDVHVPPEGKNAAEVRRMSADYGLDICSYGSYFRVGNAIDEFKKCHKAASQFKRDLDYSVIWKSLTINTWERRETSQAGVTIP